MRPFSKRGATSCRLPGARHLSRFIVASGSRAEQLTELQQAAHQREEQKLQHRGGNGPSDGDSSIMYFPAWRCLLLPPTCGSWRGQLRTELSEAAAPLAAALKIGLGDRTRRHHLVVGAAGQYVARIVSDQLIPAAGFTLVVDSSLERTAAAAVAFGRTSPFKGAPAPTEREEASPLELSEGPLFVSGEVIFFAQRLLPPSSLRGITVPYPYPLARAQHPQKLSAELLNILHEKLIPSETSNDSRLLVVTDHRSFHSKELVDAVGASKLSVSWAVQRDSEDSEAGQSSYSIGAHLLWDVVHGDYPRAFDGASLYRTVLRKTAPTPASTAAENARVTCWRYRVACG